jgi:hypothetical protein
MQDFQFAFLSADAKVQVVSFDIDRHESSASPPSRQRLARRWQDSPAWSTSSTNSAQWPGHSRHETMPIQSPVDAALKSMIPRPGMPPITPPEWQ